MRAGSTEWNVFGGALKRPGERWPVIDRRAVPKLPAAAVGHKEADEEVVLRVRIDVYKPKHRILE